MYESYYGLREKPFALVPDPAFMYPSRHHQFALMMLEEELRVLSNVNADQRQRVDLATMEQVVQDCVAGGLFPTAIEPVSV